MAPHKKATAVEATAPDNSVGSKHDIKDLIKKVDVLSMDCRIVQGHGLRLDEQGKRQDEQGISLAECKAQRDELAKVIAKLKDDVMVMSQTFQNEFGKLGASGGEHTKTLLDKKPMMLVPNEQWRDMEREVQTVGKKLEALQRENGELKSDKERLTQYRATWVSSSDRIKALENQLEQARVLALKSQEAEAQAISDKAEAHKLNDEMCADIERLQIQHDALEYEVTGFEAKEREHVKQIGEHQETQSEWDEDRHRLLMENARVQELSTENAELSESNARLRTRTKDLLHKARTSITQARNLEIEKQELEREIANTQLANSEHQMTLVQTQEKMQKLSEENARLEDTVSRYKEQATYDEGREQQLWDEIERLRQTVRWREQEIQALKVDVASLRKELATYYSD